MQLSFLALFFGTLASASGSTPSPGLTLEASSDGSFSISLGGNIFLKSSTDPNPVHFTSGPPVLYSHTEKPCRDSSLGSGCISYEYAFSDPSDTTKPLFTNSLQVR